MRDVVYIAEDSLEPRDMGLRDGGPFIADPGVIDAETTPVARPDSARDHDRCCLTAARGVAYALLYGSALWALMILLWRLVI